MYISIKGAFTSEFKQQWNFKNSLLIDAKLKNVGRIIFKDSVANERFTAQYLKLKLMTRPSTKLITVKNS